MNKTLFVLICTLFCLTHEADFVWAQPWTTTLRIAHSPDGITFDAPTAFQDSCGVPSVVRWYSDTLACVFQWAREPMDSPTWDRVAIKFSYDDGETWTEPTPVIFQGLPNGFQRPFDPTLVALPDFSMRMYFSGSITDPPPHDSLINTYSAHSVDGIHFDYEPGVRVDHPTTRVIDPAVIYFNNMWHYECPAGSPQDGAFHYISNEGLAFTQAPNIPPSPQRNWTGNYVITSPTELRFYGSTPLNMWFNSTANGGEWNGYVNCNLPGGDPTVAILNDSSYLAIFVGPLVTSANETVELPASVQLLPNFPNPFNSSTTIRFELNATENVSLEIYSLDGRRVQELLHGTMNAGQHSIQWQADSQVASGIYFCKLSTSQLTQTQKIVLIK